jgi:hypothetical protein
MSVMDVRIVRSPGSAVMNVRFVASSGMFVKEVRVVSYQGPGVQDVFIAKSGGPGVQDVHEVFYTDAAVDGIGDTDSMVTHRGTGNIVPGPILSDEQWDTIMAFIGIAIVIGLIVLIAFNPSVGIAVCAVLFIAVSLGFWYLSR